MRITARDVEIIDAVYNLKAVYATDLSENFFGGRHGLNRLQKLASSGYLTRSFTVAPNGRKNKSVYMITDKAIALLMEYGLDARERRARDMRPKGYKMVSYAEMGGLLIKLKQAGWDITNSTDSKHELGLPPNNPILCTLQSPEEKTYCAYHIPKSMRPDTALRMAKSIEENTTPCIIFYDTDSPLEKSRSLELILEAMRVRKSLTKELNLVPVPKDPELAHTMLSCYSVRKQNEYLLKQYPGGEIKPVSTPYGYAERILEHEGKKYYICDYLLRNITGLTMLSMYLTSKEYESNSTGAIIITWNGFGGEVEEILNSYEPGREFVKIKKITRDDLGFSNDR